MGIGRRLLVDTVPQDARNRGSANVGLELVRRAWGADVVHWTERGLPMEQYDVVGFNVFYPMHALNVWPFLARNPLGLHTKTVAGGQGVGVHDLLGGLVDEVFLGELDGEENREAIVSPVVSAGRKAVIEVTRGCRVKCRFCEYGNAMRYREKPIELVRAQIDEVVAGGRREVNFMSANFAGYSKLDELMEYAVPRVRVLNSDSCITFVPRLYPWLHALPRYLKLGVESFTPEVRRAIGKPFSDDFLEEVIERLLERASGVHLYLIYGLPGEDYDNWIRWIPRLAALRERYTRIDHNLFGEEYRTHSRPIRIEMSLTNFEPSPGTSMSFCPEPDFSEKDLFIARWSDALVASRFFVGERMDYVNAGGRIGRKELSYRLLMTLKRGGPELTEALRHGLPNGVGRSVSDDEARRFLDYARRTSEHTQVAR